MLCLDHATRIEDTLDALLHSLETHVLATLTLQMIDPCSKYCKLSSAAAVWTVVELLLVNGGPEMLVQGCACAEEACAKITLVGLSNGVPRLLGGFVASGTRPSEQLLGDDAIRITAPDLLIEFITAQRCLGARATLEVVS